VGAAVPVTPAGGSQQGQGIHQGLIDSHCHRSEGQKPFPRFWGRRGPPIVDCRAAGRNPNYRGGRLMFLVCVLCLVTFAARMRCKLCSAAGLCDACRMASVIGRGTSRPPRGAPGNAPAAAAAAAVALLAAAVMLLLLSSSHHCSCWGS
jgi:hypothetical protein